MKSSRIKVLSILVKLNKKCFSNATGKSMIRLDKGYISCLVVLCWTWFVETATV